MPPAPPVGRGEQMATVDAMGRQVIWEGPPCNRCGHQVIGKVFATLGKNYHPECFTCTYCYSAFPDGQFMQHDDEPYCEKCYTSLMVNQDDWNDESHRRIPRISAEGDGRELG